MKIYSQRDPNWSGHLLGSGPTSIGTTGCKLTGFSMFCGKTPIEINQILIDKGAYTDGNLMDDATVAAALGLQFGGRVSESPSDWCIAETHDNAPKYPQHFFVWSPWGIIDPYDLKPALKPNNYSVASYRLVKPLIPYIMDENSAPIPDWAIPTVQKMHDKGITTDPNSTDLPIYQVLAIMDKYNS